MVEVRPARKVSRKAPNHAIAGPAASGLPRREASGRVTSVATGNEGLQHEGCGRPRRNRRSRVSAARTLRRSRSMAESSRHSSDAGKGFGLGGAAETAAQSVRKRSAVCFPRKHPRLVLHVCAPGNFEQRRRSTAQAIPRKNQPTTITPKGHGPTAFLQNSKQDSSSITLSPNQALAALWVRKMVGKISRTGGESGGLANGRRPVSC